MNDTETIRSLLAARIVSWGGITADRIQWPNQPFNVPTDGLWARVTIQYGESFMAGMGNTPHTRTIGQLVIQIFERKGKATTLVGPKADSLRGHLAYHTNGHLETLASSRLDVGDDGNGFYQVNVITPFRFK